MGLRRKAIFHVNKGQILRGVNAFRNIEHKEKQIYFNWKKNSIHFLREHIPAGRASNLVSPSAHLKYFSYLKILVHRDYLINWLNDNKESC